MTKKQKTLSIALGVILSISIIGVTYAYFTASITNNSTAVSVTTTQLANLEMTSLKSETGTPVYPGWMGWQGIDVHATGSGEVVYDLTLNISGDSEVKNDVQIDVCKIEDTQVALAANQVTYTAATAQVNTSVTPVRYYMTGGSVTLPSGCTSVLSGATLTSLGTSTVISATGGKELNGGYRDRYYIKITYVNNPSAAQTQGQTFTITPTVTTKATQEAQVSMISCETVANSGNYTACDVNNMYVGERVKIGNDANAQYFRYIRTTDTTSQLNECQQGEDYGNSVCTDTNVNGKVGIPGAGYVRLLAEYNLNVDYDNETSIEEWQYPDAPIGLQHENVRGDINCQRTPNACGNGLGYGMISYAFNTSVYADSNLKSYVDEYASTLSTMYGIAGLSGSAITYGEIINLCDIQFGSSDHCNSAYSSWLGNTRFWTGSAYNDSYNIWEISEDYNNGGAYITYEYETLRGPGVRPIIQIAASALAAL